MDCGTHITPDYIHELLDRTHIASQHVQMALGDHPALDVRPDWQALYDAAVDNLETLYQGIGRYMADPQTSEIDKGASGS